MGNIFALIKNELDRNALNNLNVIPSRIFRRQQAELCSRGGSNTVDVDFVYSSAIRVDRGCCRLSRMHFGKLCLLKICSDPNVSLGIDCHQGLARLYDLAQDFRTGAPRAWWEDEHGSWLTEVTVGKG